MEKQELLPQINSAIDVFVAPLGTETQAAAFQLLTELRHAGIAADMDFMNRSLKAQMKYANKYPAKFVALIGEDELAQQKIMLKNMETGGQELLDMTALVHMILEGMEK